MTASKSDTWLLTKFTETTLPLPPPHPSKYYSCVLSVFSTYHFRDHLQLILANDIRLKHRSNISKNLHLFIYTVGMHANFGGGGSSARSSSTRSEDLYPINQVYSVINSIKYSSFRAINYFLLRIKHIFLKKNS